MVCTSKLLQLMLATLTTSVIAFDYPAYENQIQPRDTYSEYPGYPRYDARSPSYHTFDRREFKVITQDDVLKSYDFIIAGGGLAGLVLASRLSEDSTTTVLVLEAGLSGDAVADRINTPSGAYYSSIVGTDYDWQHITVPQQNLSNRSVSWPRGKILGGSTAMNAMYLVRPSKVEMDAWGTLLASDSTTQDGAGNWTWDSLFTAMKKSENFTAPTQEVWNAGGNFSFDASTHGRGGPMQLSYPAVMFTLVGNWTRSLATAGIPPLESPNGGVTMGSFISPSSINPANWTRSDSRAAYIDGLSPRQNLHILAEATVTKIGFSDQVKYRPADGGEDQPIANRVEYAHERGGTRYVIGVGREVILAGGALGSPKVLLHSGVGPQDTLQEVGVDLVSELPGVGQHLQDHLTAGVVWASNEETAGDVQASNSAFSKSPEFLSFINDAVAFVNATRLFGNNSGAFQQEILGELANGTATIPSSSTEVAEGYKAIYNLTANTFWNSTAQIEMLMSIISPGVVSIQSALQHPYSRGRLYINSTDPFDPVIVDPQYFSHPADRIIMRQGIKAVRDVGAAFGTLLGAETTPGPEVQTDDQIDAWLTTQGAGTQYHPAGSCAMLPKKMGGVVDSKLKVYGLANVRVADSAVFPFEFAAHLASATFGLAETAAALVKQEAFTVPSAARSPDKDLGNQPSGALRLGVTVASVIVSGLLGLLPLI